MKLMTISEVTKAFNVSTRMLRYYDEIGLLPSIRKEDYAYRMYDQDAVRRLQQIIALRKLRIPLKKIALIFEDMEQASLIEIFQENVNEINTEMEALQAIRNIINTLILRLNVSSQTHIKLNFLEDAEVIKVMETLSLSKINFKESNTMKDLNNANEVLSKLKDVRILQIPPFTVASSHFIGEAPEQNSGKNLIDFIKDTNLYDIKPDARIFGFNHPNPSEKNPIYGYEYWVTIPNDMEVPSTMKKKHFDGGLFAIHCIKMGNFHEWEWLVKWVDNSSEYDADYSEKGEEIMGGCLEEHLNSVYYIKEGLEPFDCQLDLMIPIKKK